MTINNIIKLILDIGSIAGLFSLFYTISEHRKKIAKFSFDFQGSSNGTYEKDNLEFAKFRWEGTIKNEALTENSIVEIDFVVWGNKSRTRSKANGMIFSIEDSNTNEKLSIPLNFKSKESRKINLTADIVLTGSYHNELFKAIKPIQPGSQFYLPEYEWDLLFIDINHNMFDEKGVLRSKKLMNLWWTLPNATRKLNEGKLLPVMKEYIKIFFTWVGYWIKRFFRFLGL